MGWMDVVHLPFPFLVSKAPCHLVRSPPSSSRRHEQCSESTVDRRLSQPLVGPGRVPVSINLRLGLGCPGRLSLPSIIPWGRRGKGPMNRKRLVAETSAQCGMDGQPVRAGFPFAVESDPAWMVQPSKLCLVWFGLGLGGPGPLEGSQRNKAPPSG
jgi:hypothetical protein